MKRSWVMKLKAATGGFLAMGALFAIFGAAMTDDGRWIQTT